MLPGAAGPVDRPRPVTGFAEPGTIENMIEYQSSLLDSSTEICTLTDLAAARRTPLTAGAWVDHLPGWAAGSEPLFERLLERVPWHADRRVMWDHEVDVPRLLCSYRAGDELPDPVVAQAREALSRHYAGELGEPFTTVGMCLYRNGQDSVAWHGDRIGRGDRHDTMVAILSLGSPRVLALRPRSGEGRPRSGEGRPRSGEGRPRSGEGRPGADSGIRHRFLLGHGDLVVMGGSCQRTWEHAVLKTARPVGPRISLQFRPANVF